MRWDTALLATLLTVAALPATNLHADTPDQEVQSATGLDNSQEQSTAGPTNTPGGDEALPGGISLAPAFGTDFASDDDVRDAVGDLSISMDKCPQSTTGDDERVVRVQLAKPDFETSRVVSSILLQAAKFAWANCPQQFLRLGFGTPTGQFHYDVSQIGIYLPDGSVGFSGTLGMYGRGDGAFGPGNVYVWQHLTNFAARARQQAASQAQPAVQQLVPQTVGQADAPKTLDDTFGGLWRGFWQIVEIIALLALGLWLWASRETILKWFYALKPHPAHGMVTNRIRLREPLDDSLFAEIMRPIPGSRIEQRVRAEQAQSLAAMARVAAQERYSQLERERAKAVQDAAFIRAQDDLRGAVEAHEMAVARLEALREWRNRNVR